MYKASSWALQRFSQNVYAGTSQWWVQKAIKRNLDLKIFLIYSLAIVIGKIGELIEDNLWSKLMQYCLVADIGLGNRDNKKEILVAEYATDSENKEDMER